MSFLNDGIIFTAKINKKVTFIRGFVKEIQFWTVRRSVGREIELNSSRMKRTYVFIALGAFLLLTFLIAESESFGNLIPSGKRQLHKKVCIHETAVF